MAYVNIREELGPKVYDIVLALANPNTGIVQLNSTDISIMIGTGRYDNRQIATALRYLVEDGKLEFLEYNGSYGQKFRVPELCKHNTVTTISTPYKCADDVSKSWEKETTAIKIDDAPPKTGGKTLEDMFRQAPIQITTDSQKPTLTSKERAIRIAEKSLMETAPIVGEVLTAFLQTREALESLVREVRKNEGVTKIGK